MQAQNISVNGQVLKQLAQSLSEENISQFRESQSFRRVK